MLSRVQMMLFALILPALCTGASLGDKFENTEDSKASPSAKRESGNPFDRGGQVSEKFQPWDDWVAKRGFGAADGDRFGPADRIQFQGWNDWLSKRTGAPMGDILGSEPWNAWDTARFTPGFGGANQYQRWDEFVKRNYPFIPSGGFNTLSRSNYQSWQDWMKRGGDIGSFGGAGYGNLGNNDMLMSWDDLSRLNKRYQWLGLHPFGLYRRPFSSGLQDWRASSAYGLKRSAEETTEKEEN